MVLSRCFKWSKNHLQLIISRYCHNDSLSTLHMKDNNSNDHIVWLDMEMSGLDVNTSHILEVACLITDKQLKVISEDLNIVIHQPEEVLKNMSDWCMINHQKTGLIGESESSKITVQDAEQILFNYLEKHVTKGTCPIAGSSVYMDRMFLHKYMPAVNNYLHYRIIDTSTVKELIKRWNLSVPKLPKEHSHRALSDIKESIKELEHYKRYIFNV